MRPFILAGRLLAAAALLVCALAVAQTQTVDQLVLHADQIKYTHNDEFLAVLKQLDAQGDRLSSSQRDWLAYFHAWQLGYSGDYEKALDAFHTLLDRTPDQTIRARSRVSLIYDQVNAAHLEDAYTTLSELLGSLGEIQDHNTHFLVLATAAFLYGNAGQYDLAQNYVGQMLAYDNSDRSVCLALTTEADNLSASGKLRSTDSLIQRGIDACERADDLLYANNIRTDLALAQINEGHAADALKMLKDRDAETLALRSATAISEFRSALARAYFATGDYENADRAAQSAVAYANTQTNARSVVSAYSILYQIAKKHGDDKSALANLEKFAAADKGYLTDVSARALAYQMVHQRVLDNQRQLQAANDANKVLSLQQQVDAQRARTRLLYALLLLCGLLIVAGWAYRTKRSQLKFQKLARVDSLTGICNRQHFFDSAQDALRYCARNSRPASLLALDLDHFKSVNDMHGHAAGDAALQAAVAACQSRLRSIDVFGRLGGEEFAILLPDCPLAMATQRAEEMRQAIATSSGDSGANVLVTASFGVAGTDACGHNLTTLLAHADNALYAAKRAGRNRVETHHIDANAAAT
ncbi:MAG: diguanylate cyclase [Proteobacteria bacterium]|nr:diguanylate cyclase [Pseudomonadota bacterium]